MQQITADEIKQLMLETEERQQEFEHNAPIIALRKELARIERKAKRSKETMTAIEYILMASGEIITEERIAAWADASGEDAEDVKAKLLASGEIVLLNDYVATLA